jgi:hypothetical protein
MTPVSHRFVQEGQRRINGAQYRLSRVSKGITHGMIKLVCY